VNVVTLRELSGDSPTLFSYGNVAKAYTQGGELSTRVALPYSTFVDVGYSLIDARDEGTGQLLEGRAIHRGTVNLLWRYRPWGLEANVRAAITGKRQFFVDNDGDGQLEPIWTKGYAVLDARVAKQLTSWLSVYVTGTNLLNAGDPTWLLIPPLGVQAGVIARY
jgi:outer membrane receptor for ferrienterochelin and colicins